MANISFRLTKDTITPDVQRKLRAIKDPRPVLEAMGLQLVSLTQRAFSDDSLRAAVWKPRKKNYPWAILRKSGSLMKSIAIKELTGSSVKVGSDRVYAAVHQLGSKKETGRGGGIPARPFFPVRNGRLTELAAGKINEIARAKISKLLHS